MDFRVVSLTFRLLAATGKRATGKYGEMEAASRRVVWEEDSGLSGDDGGIDFRTKIMERQSDYGGMNLCRRRGG